LIDITSNKKYVNIKDFLSVRDVKPRTLGRGCKSIKPKQIA